MAMIYFYVCCLLFFAPIAIFGHRIQKRFLTYHNPALYQIVVGVNVPTEFNKRIISLSAGYQMNFELPTNASVWDEEYIIKAKRSLRSDPISTRYRIYKHLENLIETFGLKGPDCLLRTICESSAVPFEGGPTDNILEEMLHFLLTPSLDKAVDIVMKNSVYADAEQNGRNGENCEFLYESCSISLLDTFTNKIINYS